MKIGVIVYSKTGNTLSVAKALQESLTAAGYEAAIEQVKPENEENVNMRKASLAVAPAVGAYDAVIFGGPVWGFACSSVLQAYLHQIPSLEGKQVLCFVTMSFPYAWMGGNRAIGQMKAVCLAKGAALRGTGIIHWGSKGRGQQISELAKRFAKAF